MADGTLSGRIDGDGITLTLAGANTYSGGTAFSGALQVAADANLGAAGGGLLLVGGRLLIDRDFTTYRPITLADLEGALSTFDSNGHDLTLAGPISGPGSLRKEGNGTLTLLGENTFAGAAEVASGRLAVESALAGDLTIDAGAEAGGAGFIAGDLTNHGRLARRATFGPITVGGSVTFAPGSALTIKADPTGNADHLLLTGAVGVLGAYSQPRLEQDANLTETNSTQIGAYGSYRHRAIGADLVVTLAEDRTESSRQVNIGGLGRQAEVNYDGHGNAITTELRYTLPGEPITLQPLIGLQWSRQRQDAYTETGAGGLNLTVPAETTESLCSTLGLGAGLFPAKGATGLAVEGRVGWRHEFQDRETIGASLSGDPTGTLFSLTGADIPRDSAQFSLGLGYTGRPALRLYLDLDSAVNNARQELTLTAGLGYRW